MRLLVLLMALLAVCPLARAQRMPAHTPAVSNPSPRAAPAQPVTPDTAAALHRLFAGRRHRRNAIAIGLGAGLALNIIDAGLTATADAAGRSPILSLGSAPGYLPAPSGGTSVAATWLLAVLPSSALIALDYLVHAGFTHKREALALEAYQAGKLSQRLRKKLRPRHFQPAEAR